MRGTPRLVALGVGLLALALVPPIAGLLNEPFYVDLFRRMMIVAIAAVSLDLILGYGGMVSLGHAAFFGIGAYVVAILNYHATQDTLFLGIVPGTRNPLITWPAAIEASRPHSSRSYPLVRPKRKPAA